jgi:hypothetical protein
MGVSGQRHAPATLYPPERTPVPIVQEAGWAPEPVWTQRLEEKILSPLPGIEPLSHGRPARSETLYRLSYPAHLYAVTGVQKLAKWLHYNILRLQSTECPSQADRI